MIDSPSGRMTDYLPPEHFEQWKGWTLDGAWDHKTPWLAIEKYGDLPAAFGALFRTPKDMNWSDLAAIHYAMVNQ